MSNEYMPENEIRDLNKKQLSVYDSEINHAQELKKMKVLVVDDSGDIRNVLSEIITLQGHEAVLAQNGRVGLEMIKNDSFDLVLLDLLMPEFSGLDVIDSLEKTGMIKLNKIVVLTASAISSEELNTLKKKGMYMWMRKPIKFDEFVSLLRNIPAKE